MFHASTSWPELFVFCTLCGNRQISKCHDTCVPLQVKGSYKLSELGKKGPAKPKAKKPATKVCHPPQALMSLPNTVEGNMKFMNMCRSSMAYDYCKLEFDLLGFRSGLALLKL